MSSFIHAPEPATIATWLIAPVFGPDLRLPDLKGETHSLSSLKGRPVLLVFVDANCGIKEQLEQLQHADEALSGANLTLFVVVSSTGTDWHAIDELIGSPRFSFRIHMADERSIGAWNIQYRYLFDRRRDMSFPISFLIDKSGAIIRIYQGLAAPQDVVQDWRTAPVTPEQRFARAMPFPGSYYGVPMKHDYLTFGIAFVEYGYTDEALAAFQRVVDADPDRESAWFNLGTIYLNKKMYSEAQRCLAEAVRLNPQDSDAWNNLGMISGEQEKYDEALDQFRHAALANPNHLLAVENMMKIYRFQGRATEAQKTLEELIARAPGNADLHLGLAMTLVAQNDLSGARKELETSVQLKPNNPDALNDLGAVLLRMGKGPEALATFEESRRQAPDSDRPCINIALIYNKAGQPAKARQVLEEFLSRHPDNADVRAALEKTATP